MKKLADSVLEPAEAARLVDAATPGTGLAAFVRLGLITGARRGELLEVRWPDVGYDDDRGCGTLLIACRNGGKTTRARRQVALDLRTMAMLEVWREEQKAAGATARATCSRLAWPTLPRGIQPV
jgi:integrase